MQHIKRQKTLNNGFNKRSEYNTEKERTYN